VDLDRSLVFPSVEYARYVVVKSGSNWAGGTMPVVIDCKHIQFADYSAAQVYSRSLLFQSDYRYSPSSFLIAPQQIIPKCDSCDAI